MKAWLIQLSRRFLRLLKRRNDPSIPSESDAVTTSVAASPLPAPPQGQGLKCPECKSGIPVSIPLLLSGGPFVCPGCGLRLNINRTESQSALGALAKLDTGMKKARQASGQS